MIPKRERESSKQMRTARLYDTPEEFAVMMRNHINNEMGMPAIARDDEPLLIDVRLPEQSEGYVQVSLHECYRTYKAGGDMNIVVDRLNAIMNVTNLIRAKGDGINKFDASYIYPAIRGERYVIEAGSLDPFIAEPYLPGLSVIYIEIKDGCSKIATESTLSANPRFTAERVKRLAYRNLRSAGWQFPRLELRSPFRPSCTVEAYLDNSHPVECQFLLPEMAAPHMPEHCVVAFTNRQTALLLRSTERMDTSERALRLVDKSRFKEIVKRSYHLMPSPVSMRLFWISQGQATLLEG